MLLLLDENLPKGLKKDFPNHRVFTIRDMGWDGLKNGQLLQKLLENKFDALLTFDKNLKYQQNFKTYTIAVLVLSARKNTYKELTQLSEKVNLALNDKLEYGATEIK